MPGKHETTDWKRISQHEDAKGAPPITARPMQESPIRELLPRGARQSVGNEGALVSRGELMEMLERQMRNRARRRNMGEPMPIERAVMELRGLFGGGKR